MRNLFDEHLLCTDYDGISMNERTWNAGTTTYEG